MRYRQRATIVKDAGTPDETRTTVPADVQPKMGFFPVTAQIDVGDIVEVPDPRPGRGVIRYTVGEVEVYSGYGHGDHIETKWGPAAKAPDVTPKVLALGDLHPVIADAAGRLYRDGYFGQAVFEAFKAVESSVRDKTDIDLVGHKLMSQAFGGVAPQYSLTQRSGQLGRDEQEGRALMLMGAMRGIRNLRAHALDGMDQAPALELLVLASQMMRWIDESAMNL